ncbi:MAG TPA: MotA/TolQ/ExbB proton channel family protein [Candidatus Cloacimonadota bacterium]|nr:MotA/TolQ/ExbB proton channel family protein [Candidatus Cloacimonadota bacterium]HPM00544.1 MotA/TolQ/ExbB proton channel family protein [Candidatus Cloacimonadota bacterium]
MDIGTILGVLAGLGLILTAIMMGSRLQVFIDYPSMMVVGGGTIAALFIAYPMKSVFLIIKVTKKAIFHKPMEIHTIIADASRFSPLAKTQGAIALEKELGSVKDEYFKKGLQMIADGTSLSVINDIMGGEIGLMRERHALGRNIYNDIAKFAPAFGMIGTLIGLVQMLSNLSDPNSIGPSMAVALLTTFYGSVIANLVATPLATKLKGRSEDETLAMRLTLEAIKSISKNESRNIIEDKLAVFLSGEMRKKMNAGK